MILCNFEKKKQFSLLKTQKNTLVWKNYTSNASKNMDIIKKLILKMDADA